MKSIWYLPIEPLQQRYTEQMFRWVTTALDRIGTPYVVVNGGKPYDKIKHGQWLDTTRTTSWKLRQILELTAAIESGEVRKGDLVLLGDVWMPGIEAIRFQSDLLGLDLKIGGWHYAGCFDHFDFLARSLGAWGPKYEAALIEGVLDSICFGSPYHRQFVERHCRLPRHASTEGLAWDHYEVAAFRQKAKPKNIVAYTHRWSKEKRPNEFLRIAKAKVGGKRSKFVISTSGEVTDDMKEEAAWAGCEIVKHKSKSDYYKWLSTVSVMWSGADQETFGYSFMEAVALGVRVAAPIRACYPDHLTRQGLAVNEWLYGPKDPFGAGMVTLGLSGGLDPMPVGVSLQYHNAHERYIRQFIGAFK